MGGRFELRGALTTLRKMPLALAVFYILYRFNTTKILIFQFTLTFLKSLRLFQAPPLNFIPYYPELLFQYSEINDFWNKVYTRESMNSVSYLAPVPK